MKHYGAKRMMRRENCTRRANFHIRLLWLAAVGGLVLASAGGATVASQARTADRFDGRWLVVAVTEAGPCDASFAYPVRVENGQVSSAGTANFNIVGQIDNAGGVHITISSHDRRADVDGRLSSGRGGGRWSGTSSVVSCTGSWSALRG